MKIPYNKPFITGKETDYINDAVLSGKISGNGIYSKKCHSFFEEKYGFKKCLLTTSCTDALEMVSILLDVCPDDEIIIPSYTFVSSANAFALRGAKIIFADSGNDNPNIDPHQIEKLISPNTKAIVLVHYAGVSCDMDRIMDIANEHNIYVVEDAAQAIDSYHNGKALGSFGHFATFSFHETKNIIAGEGGMLVVNDDRFIKRAEIIWEKGTNRAAFFRGEVNKYGWVDIGSSFLPSEIIAAFLYAQLENIQSIQDKRKALWERYQFQLSEVLSSAQVGTPNLPDYATNNAHIYYIVCNSLEERSALIQHLKNHDVLAVFHYLSLHKSPYFEDKYQGDKLVNCDRYSDCLLRLPLFYDLSFAEQQVIIDAIIDFYK